MTILASLPTITGVQASICKLRRMSMSLSHNADILDGSIQSAEQSADRKSDYRFVLALICMALALTIASAIFTPVALGSGIPLEIGGPPYP
jgi:hypothetical protein